MTRIVIVAVIVFAATYLLGASHVVEKFVPREPERVMVRFVDV